MHGIAQPDPDGFASCAREFEARARRLSARRALSEGVSCPPAIIATALWRRA
jgi:hypothetical protein